MRSAQGFPFRQQPPNPMTASMATRPWVTSASRYRFKVSTLAFSANPRGSKNPMGARAPGIVSMLKPLREVERAPVWAGAKAAAEPARAEIRASFIIFMLVKRCV
ncbi:hypothetical protein ACHAXM_005095 [Skeletonema potamos]